ncbi:MAG: signal peptidase I [Patescibacteria group bacterium]|nr:signal peptidase I [Patescibacteria group bacterium]MDE1988529.1 signal peptidase I [Patescibacteria group bacterium]MDE2217863.1 signal peptidase I [Patescibacteria group bacterium]
MEQENKKSNYPQKNLLKTEQAPAERKKKENFFKELIKFVLLAAVIVLPIRFFIAQPFIVSGGSMDPTFANGQYLIVDEISYRFEKPRRGDVIIFRYPLDTKKFFIKRIIGLPSETITISGGKVSVTDKEGKKSPPFEEPYIDSKIDTGDRNPITLKNDEYFVMGDNRTESFDSRYWGPLKESLIIGRPFARLFPITKINLLPGASVPVSVNIGQN